MAYTLNKYNTTHKAREKIEKLFELKYIEKGDTMMFAFGEPDIRGHVFKEVEKQNRTPEEIIDDILDNYFEFLQTLTNDYNVWVWGPIASPSDDHPSNPDYYAYGTEVERNKAALYFNEKLEELGEKFGVKTFSIAKDMVDEDFHTKRFLLADEIHLSQRAWKYAIPEFKKVGLEVTFKEEWWKANVSPELPKVDQYLLQSAGLTMGDYQERLVKSIREHLIVSDTDVPFANIGKLALPVDCVRAQAVYSFADEENMDFEETMANYNMPVFFWKAALMPKKRDNLKQLNVNLVASPALKREEKDLTLIEVVARTGFLKSDNLVLRINLNFAEYDILSEMGFEFLQKFKVISIRLNRLLDANLRAKSHFALDKLNATHDLVYVRAFDNAFVINSNGKIAPDEMEATYILKGSHNVFKSKRFFPCDLDYGLNCVNLGYWG